jgi:hypothetical protein
MVKGKITSVVVLIIIASMIYLALWTFYADTITEFDDVSNFTIDDRFNETRVLFNESLMTTHADMIATEQNYTDTTGGTDDTATNKMILNSFKVIKNTFTTIKSSFKIISDTANKLYIPSYWTYGTIAIILVVILIAVISGFLKATNW